MRGDCLAVRSEGHVLVLASVHETWPRPASGETVVVATDSWDICGAMRAAMMSSPQDFPSSLEYMNKEAVQVVKKKKKKKKEELWPKSFPNSFPG